MHQDTWSRVAHRFTGRTVFECRILVVFEGAGFHFFFSANMTAGRPGFRFLVPGSCGRLHFLPFFPNF
jgi:hypothetical protein